MAVAAARCNIGDTALGTVSADGTQLWLSGRDDREVYMINTADGSLDNRILAGDGSHGRAPMPQPGRYSTGVTR